MWTLKLDRHDRAEATIVTVTGRLGAATASALAGALDQVGPGRHVVLDCRGIDYISSAGLNLLVRAAARLKETGGSLRVSELQEAVRVSLDVSGAEALLELAEPTP